MMARIEQFVISSNESLAFLQSIDDEAHQAVFGSIAVALDHVPCKDSQVQVPPVIHFLEHPFFGGHPHQAFLRRDQVLTGIMEITDDDQAGIIPLRLGLGFGKQRRKHGISSFIHTKTGSGCIRSV